MLSPKQTSRRGPAAAAGGGHGSRDQGKRIETSGRSARRGITELVYGKASRAGFPLCGVFDMTAMNSDLICRILNPDRIGRILNATGSWGLDNQSAGRDQGKER